jgi:DNA-binding PadR family transcriptional regulator
MSASYAAGRAHCRPHGRRARRHKESEAALEGALLMMRGGRGEFGGFGGPGGGFSPFGPGPGGPGGPFRGRGRGGRARRGDIRTAALLLLAQEPRNGYAIMQELEERTDGAWRPSPGSVYPALAQLEDEGLIRSEAHDERKLFALTDQGRAHLAERPKDAPAPWDTLADGVPNDLRELHSLFKQVAAATFQLAHHASADQIAEAKKVLIDTRRAMYRILGDGDDAGEDRA